MKGLFGGLGATGLWGQCNIACFSLEVCGTCGDCMCIIIMHICIETELMLRDSTVQQNLNPPTEGDVATPGRLHIVVQTCNSSLGGFPLHF